MSYSTHVHPVSGIVITITPYGAAWAARSGGRSLIRTGRTPAEALANAEQRIAALIEARDISPEGNITLWLNDTVHYRADAMGLRRNMQPEAGDHHV